MANARFTTSLESLGGDPFVLVAGAGISIWHPSSLPTWREFSITLLDGAKECALSDLPARTEFADDIERLTIDDVGSKAFSHALVDIVAGEDYFETVTALDWEQPNPAHRAIARLVGSRRIRAVITTNFDTLIERALMDEGTVFQRLSDPRDYIRTRNSSCPIYKIHGSAGDRTVVDTVGQKLRGLPLHVGAELSDLFSKYRIVVLGYSGGDLEFGPDYLGLRSASSMADSILWIVRPQERDSLEKRVQNFVADRGTFVLMEQNAAIAAMGVGPVELEWNMESRRERLKELQSLSRRLYRELGGLNVLAFCMRLLSSSGKTGAATQVWRFLDEAIGKRSDQTVRALGPAMRALTAEGLRLVGVQGLEKWACRQIRDIRSRREDYVLTPASPPGDRLVSHKRPSSDKEYERDALYEGLACLSLAEAKMLRSLDDRAGIALQRAMATCEYLGEITMLPAVYRLFGWREALRVEYGVPRESFLRDFSDDILHGLMKHENTARLYLLTAEAAGLLAGNLDAVQSALIRADLLMKRGEYDAALICVDRVEDRVGLGLHRETIVDIERLRGLIELRQGGTKNAVERWEACLAGEARGNPTLEASLKHLHVGFIGFDPAWRDLALRFCRELQGEMNRGRLPKDGSMRVFSTLQYYEIVERNLVSLGSHSLKPGFVQRLDCARSTEEFERWPTYYARQWLMHLEYEGDVDNVLDWLDHLVGWYMETGDPTTTLDAALAHLRRATIQGNDDQRFIAECNVAAVRNWLGDREWADTWYHNALANERGKDPQVQHGLTNRLPHFGWKSTGPPASLTERSVELDLYDIVDYDWRRHRGATHLEEAALRAVAENNFIMGRLYALQGIAAYRDRGNVAGFERCFTLLRDLGKRDRRSHDDVLDLC